MTMGSRLPLKQAPVGVPLKVVEFDCGREAQCRLIGLGILPGSRVVITNRFSANGPFSVIVNGSKVIVGRGLLDRIFVEEDVEVYLEIAVLGLAGAGKRALISKVCGGIEEEVRKGTLAPILVGQTIWRHKRIRFSVLPSVMSDPPWSVYEEVGLRLALEGSYDWIVVLGREETLERDLLLVHYLVDLGKRVVLAVNGSLSRYDARRIRELTGVEVVYVSSARGYGMDAVLASLEKGPGEVRFSLPLEFPLEECLLRVKGEIPEGECSIVYPLDGVVVKVFESEQDALVFFKNPQVRERLIEGRRFCEERCRHLTGRSLEECVFDRRLALVRGVLEESKQDRAFAREVVGRLFWGLVLLGWLYGLALSVGGAVKAGMWLLHLIGGLRGVPLYVQGGVFFLGILLMFVLSSFVFFFFQTLLHESHLMYKIAFALDPVLHLFGFHGVSLVPLLHNLGCSIPAVELAGRLLQGRDRTALTMALPMGNCLGVWVVFAFVLFVSLPFWEATGWLFSLILASLIYTALFARLFKGIIGARSLEAPSITALPALRWVPLISALEQGCYHAFGYARKVAGVFLGVSLVLWAVKTYTPIGGWLDSVKVGDLAGLDLLALVFGLWARELVLAVEVVFRGMRFPAYGISSPDLMVLLFLLPGCFSAYRAVAKALDRKTAVRSFLWGLAVSVGVFLAIKGVRWALGFLPLGGSLR